MKNVIITLILIISPTTLLAEDNWYTAYGVAYINGDARLDNLSEAIDEHRFSVYLTPANNLDFTYRIGISERRFIFRPHKSQLLFSTDILYNLLSSSNGWFVDLELGLTIPLTSTEFIDVPGATDYSDQESTGTRYALGFGKTLSKSITFRIAIGTEQSEALYRNGSPVITELDYITYGILYSY